MADSQKKYQEIFKATSLFGGVQVINIIIAVIRSKFVAVFLGPTGMGIAGLLISTTDFLARLTNLGLGTSSVKNVAEAASTNDDLRVSVVITVLRRLVWFTGLAGLVITAVLSPVLSQITFGNKDYSAAFVWISVTLLFQQLTSGQLVVLQGLRRLDSLAKANLLGSIIGLAVIIPIYYFFRIDGIVPAIILVSFISLALSWFYSRKVAIKSIKISTRETLFEGRDMVKMGILLSLSGLISLGVAYVIRIYISNTGGVEQVGLYSAGFAIINTYVGMIFTAMGTDYYPRLSSVASNNMKAKEMINQQGEIAILILAPILTVFLIFINWVIILLYSEKFIAVNEMIQWAALGMYFKAISWSIAYVFLAKGAARLFFWNELIANLLMLGLNIVGYRIAGLEGLGISFLVGYLLYLIQVYIIASTKFSFRFSKDFYMVACIQIVLGIICFGTMRFLDSPWNYILGCLVIIISSVYSVRELERRIGFKEIIQKLLDKFRNKKS